MGSIDFTTIGIIVLFNILFISLMTFLTDGFVYNKKRLKRSGFQEGLIEIQKKNNDRWGKLFLTTFIIGQIL